MATVLLATSLIIILLQPVAGLQVSPGSPCAAYCLDDREKDPFSADSSHTSTSEIVCQVDDFSSLDEGKKFKDCISCLKDSQFTNGTESDSTWLLYNLRFATDTCIFGSPRKVEPELQLNSTCVTTSTCLPLKDALANGVLEPSEGGEYAYCTAAGEAFVGKNLRPCVTCLEDDNEQVFVSNFINALAAACAYKPTPGSTFLKGDLFSKEGIEVAAPATTNPTESDGKGPETPNGLSTTQIVGIVVGVASAFLIAAVLFVIHFLRQKKLAQQQLQQYHEYHEHFEKMIMSTGTSVDHDFARTHEPTSTWHHPVEPTPPKKFCAPKIHMLRAPSPDTRSVSTASVPDLPAHPAYLPGVHSREDLRIREVTPPLPAAKKHENAQNPDAFDLPIMLDTPQRLAFMQQKQNENSAAIGRPANSSSHSPQQPVRNSEHGSMGPVIMDKLPRPPPQQSKTPPPRQRTQAGRHAPSNLNISSPVHSNAPRFHDRPLMGGQVMATRVPDRAPDFYAHVNNAPLQSASSNIW